MAAECEVRVDNQNLFFSRVDGVDKGVVNDSRSGLRYTIHHTYLFCTGSRRSVLFEHAEVLSGILFARIVLWAMNVLFGYFVPKFQKHSL